MLVYLVYIYKIQEIFIPSFFANKKGAMIIAPIVYGKMEHLLVHALYGCAWEEEEEKNSPTDFFSFLYPSLESVCK
jgi:hypothetical protein